MADRSDALPLQKCPVCGQRDFRALFRLQNYPVCQCRACGAQFLNPQPSDAALADIYTGHYFLGSGDLDAETRFREMKRKTAALYCDLLCRQLGASSGRLLEIGCGWGDFLLEAAQRGFEVSGVEISSDSAAVANRRLGAPRVHAGILENAPLAEGSFDVVAFFDVIEHVRDPLAFLNRVAALLRPGGLLMLVTPALDSLSARLMSRHWMDYKVEHLFYFSGPAIRRVLERAGFSRVEIHPNRKILSFDYISRHFAHFPVPVLTPLMNGLRRLCPDRLADRCWQLRASGLLVLAEKA